MVGNKLSDKRKSEFESDQAHILRFHEKSSITTVVIIARPDQQQNNTENIGWGKGDHHGAGSYRRKESFAKNSR